MRRQKSKLEQKNGMKNEFEHERNDNKKSELLIILWICWKSLMLLC